MFKIGCHLSIGQGYLAAGKQAKSIGATTFQFFSRNPRGGMARAVDYADINRFNDFIEKESIFFPLAHAPYTINPCSADENTRGFAKRCMQDDLLTLGHIKGAMYNIHPGSHTGQGTEEGIRKIVEILNSVMKENISTVVLLEAMAGKGSEVGGNFSELGEIIRGVHDNSRLGVLIDTCHVYSAGYDIVKNLDGVLEEFDKAIGLGFLRAIHLNDSMTGFASHKDRHAAIGEGSIGTDAFANLINHKSLRDLPFYLETPNEVEGYAREIALLKSLRNGD